MAEDKEQRTEDASEKKREDSRNKGQFAQSKEVTSSFIMLAMLIAFYFYGPFILGQLMGYMKDVFFEAGSVELNAQNIVPLLFEVMKIILMTILPFVTVIMVAAIIVNILQGGGIVFTAEPLTPKFSKLNPVKGIGKVISKSSFGELVKSILKIIIVGSIAYRTVNAEFTTIPLLMELEGEAILQYIAEVSLKIMFFTLLAMIILSVIDFLYQKYLFEESIKMTKQELKDEHKSSEGDPALKAKIRNIQMEVARRRMMEAVPKADVVITNPTHFAIAIQYDKNMVAPVVIAKGTGFIAQKIKKIATESGVPLYENKPLARTLFKSVDIGEMIPSVFFKAVAEILAYVYRLKGKA
ncbi:MAG: flagellar biosynthesis protein FlhB [Nitrospinota bacterium]